MPSAKTPIWGRTGVHAQGHQGPGPRSRTLGGIRGAAQLLARELDDSKLTEYTDVIMEEADRLRTLLTACWTPERGNPPHEHP